MSESKNVGSKSGLYYVTEDMVQIWELLVAPGGRRGDSVYGVVQRVAEELVTHLSGCSAS